MADIQLERVRKMFGKVLAVADVSLHIKEGEFMVLLGPSGCGKTTLLRCLAGLERVDGGQVIIGGDDVTDHPPGKRGIGMVFQSYAVFPHMTVFDNIAFGLQMQRVSSAEIQRRVGEGAELLQIQQLLARYPAQLSGGQRQRVAVARAIVMRPRVLLMDEPLSNLDALLRLQMRGELKRLHHEVRSTTVYVTHDQVEALSLGDRIAVMKDGTIVQLDIPDRVYDLPATRFVGSFIGSPPMNFLEGTIRSSNGARMLETAGVRLEFHGVPARGRDAVLIGIRPEHIAVERAAVAGGIPAGAIPAAVVVVEPIGPQKLLTVQVGPSTLKVTTPVDFAVDQGQRVWLRFDPSRIRLMDPQTGDAIAS